MPAESAQVTRPNVSIRGFKSSPARKSAWFGRSFCLSVERFVCYLLSAICYSGLGVAAQAGDILRGNTGGNNSGAAKSTFSCGSQAAIAHKQNNAKYILTRAAPRLHLRHASQHAP